MNIVKTKTLSIVIPTIGRVGFLDKLLDTAINQSDPADEILVFDNSRDQNLKDMSQFGESVLISWHSSGGQLNAIDSWNKAFLAASSEYVITVGDDDLLMPNVVSEARKMITLADFGVLKAIRIDENDNYESDLTYPESNIFNSAEFRFLRMNTFISLFVPGLVFKKVLFEKAGGFINSGIDGYAYSDEFLCYKLSYLSGKVAVSEEVCWKYRYHSGQIKGVLSLKYFVNNALEYEKKMVESLLDLGADQNEIYPKRITREIYLYSIYKYTISQFVKMFIFSNRLKIYEFSSEVFSYIAMEKRIKLIQKTKLIFTVTRMLIQFSIWGLPVKNV